MAAKKREDEEEKKEKAAEEEHPGYTTWICPACNTSYKGWSTLNKCSKCGYEEK